MCFSPTVPRQGRRHGEQVRRRVDHRQGHCARGRVREWPTGAKVETLALHRITDSEWADRLFVRTLAAKGSDNRYDVIDDGFQRGVLAYADGSGETSPSCRRASPGQRWFAPTRTTPGYGNEFLSFEINLPANLYVAYDAGRARRCG